MELILFYALPKIIHLGIETNRWYTRKKVEQLLLIFFKEVKNNQQKKTIFLR